MTTSPMMAKTKELQQGPDGSLRLGSVQATGSPRRFIEGKGLRLSKGFLHVGTI